jgi:hypothetical protein
LWLIRLGIRVSHSRPYHPRTQGKNECLNGTLNREVVMGRTFHTLDEVQAGFDRWRSVYNLERPHEVLAPQTPASRYRPSPRPFPETLPPVEYPEGALVRRVQDNGWIGFKGQAVELPKALESFAVAIEPRTAEDGVFGVRFCETRVQTFTLNLPADHNNV